MKPTFIALDRAFLAHLIANSSYLTGHKIEVQSTYARRAPLIDQPHSAMISRSQFQSSPYPNQVQMGASAVGTNSLPPSFTAGTPQHTAQPMFPISAARLRWKKLPSLVLTQVLEQLRCLHFDYSTLSCSTCYIRDLCSVQLSCKAWFSDAQRIL